MTGGTGEKVNPDFIHKLNSNMISTSYRNNQIGIPNLVWRQFIRATGSMGSAWKFYYNCVLLLFIKLNLNFISILGELNLTDSTNLII